MTRPCPWTVALLVCFCSAIGARAFSAYDKKLELLSTIVKQDYLWREIFLEGIYFKLDRTYYKDIIDNELLHHAKYEPPPTRVASVAGEASGEGQTSGGGDASNVVPPQVETRDSIKPYEFVRNIMVKRFVVGSILDMGLEILMVSFKCLMYKHMVHLSKLIQVEMIRGSNVEKAASWSGKSIEHIESILMTMGALQFTDIHVLATLSFFDIYKSKGKTMSQHVKNEYSNQLGNRSKEMLDYVSDNCVLKPIKDKNISQEKQVADMLDVIAYDSLYKPITAMGIKDSEYKKMIVSSRKKISDIFGTTPRVNGMSETMWDNILHFQDKLTKNE